MNTFTYLYEIFFLGIGIYLLLFNLGILQPKNPEQAQKMKEMREFLSPWGILLSIGIIVLFALSLIFHLWQDFFL